jgi:hypothetical protein
MQRSTEQIAGKLQDRKEASYQHVYDYKARGHKREKNLRRQKQKRKL